MCRRLVEEAQALTTEQMATLLKPTLHELAWQQANRMREDVGAALFGASQLLQQTMQQRCHQVMGWLEEGVQGRLSIRDDLCEEMEQAACFAALVKHTLLSTPFPLCHHRFRQGLPDLLCEVLAALVSIEPPTFPELGSDGGEATASPLEEDVINTLAAAAKGGC